MANSLGAFFTNRLEPSGADSEDDLRYRVQVAACALLLELAHADDEFSEDERTHIEAVLIRHFDLDEETAVAMMELAEAERRHSTDLHPFAELIRKHYDEGQKTLLAEIMWGVILSDGRIAKHEGRLLNRLAHLLDLKRGYLADARRTANMRILE